MVCVLNGCLLLICVFVLRVVVCCMLCSVWKWKYVLLCKIGCGECFIWSVILWIFLLVLINGFCLSYCLWRFLSYFGDCWLRLCWCMICELIMSIMVILLWWSLCYFINGCLNRYYILGCWLGICWVNFLWMFILMCLISVWSMFLVCDIIFGMLMILCFFMNC